MPVGPGYEYAEEVHPTAFIRGNASSRSADARDAEDGAESGAAGAGMGGGSGNVGLVCADSVLGSGLDGAVGGVVFLFVKQLRPTSSPSFASRVGAGVAQARRRRPG